MQELCPELTIEESDGDSDSECVAVNTRSSRYQLRLGERKQARLDSFGRSFEGQMDAILNKVPGHVLSKGLEEGWRAALKAGQRALGGTVPAKQVKLKEGVYVVQKLVGVEESKLGRRYKVVWAGWPGEDSWEREGNLVGAEEMVSAFWCLLGEPIPSDGVLELT